MKFFSGAEPSQKLQLSTEDLKKLGIKLLVLIIGVTLTFLEQTIPVIDFGMFTPVAIVVNTMIIETVRKFLKDNGLAAKK